MSPDTLVIDLRFKGVGRINRRSGTTNPVALKKIKRTLRELHEDGRLDILRAIRDKQVTALEVYDAARRRALHELPIGETMPLLSAAMDRWIAGAKQAQEYSPNHLVNLKTARNYFAAIDPNARVADLPRVLKALRGTVGVKHPRSFNIARGSATSFVRATLGRAHPLWIACMGVEPRKVATRAPGEPLTPDRMLELFPHPAADRVDAIAWSMATTGMRNGEYFGRWETLSDRIHVSGTKTKGAVRDVPLVRAPTVPTLSRDRLQRLFRTRLEDTAPTLTPYDLRRTYARWLELAGISRTRRRIYLGHGAKDVSDLYERHEVTTFLAEDAKKLRTLLAAVLATIDPPASSTGSFRAGSREGSRVSLAK